MEWFEGTFKNGPRQLTRIILRFADPNVDHIRSGEVIVTNASDESATVAFDLANVLSCAYMINFEHTAASTKAIADEATKVKVTVATTFSLANDNVGFKVDVFVRLPTVST